MKQLWEFLYLCGEHLVDQGGSDTNKKYLKKVIILWALILRHCQN